MMSSDSDGLWMPLCALVNPKTALVMPLWLRYCTTPAGYRNSQGCVYAKGKIVTGLAFPHTMTSL